MQKKPDKQSKQQENDQGDQYAGQVIHRTCKEIRNPSGTDDIQIQLRIPDAIGVLVLKQMELITGFRKVLSGWRGFIRYKGVGESLDTFAFFCGMGINEGVALVNIKFGMGITASLEEELEMIIQKLAGELHLHIADAFHIICNIELLIAVDRGKTTSLRETISLRKIRVLRDVYFPDDFLRAGIGQQI